MKVMLHPIQVHMADKALTRCQINTQCLFWLTQKFADIKTTPSLNAFTSGTIKNKILFVCCAAAEMGAAGRIDITSLIPHRSRVCIPLDNRKVHLISVKFPRKSWLFIDFLTYDMV